MPKRRILFGVGAGMVFTCLFFYFVYTIRLTDTDEIVNASLQVSDEEVIARALAMGFVMQGTQTPPLPTMPPPTQDPGQSLPDATPGSQTPYSNEDGYDNGGHYVPYPPAYGHEDDPPHNPDGYDHAPYPGHGYQGDADDPPNDPYGQSDDPYQPGTYNQQGTYNQTYNQPYYNHAVYDYDPIFEIIYEPYTAYSPYYEPYSAEDNFFDQSEHDGEPGAANPGSQSVGSSSADSAWVYIPSGTTATGIARILNEAGVIDNVSGFIAFLTDGNYTTRMHSGAFDLLPGTDYDALVDTLAIRRRIQ